MSLKTDNICYNEDNFVEEDGQVHEWLEKFKEVFGSNTEQSNEEITEETESETENDEPV